MVGRLLSHLAAQALLRSRGGGWPATAARAAPAAARRLHGVTEGEGWARPPRGAPREAGCLGCLPAARRGHRGGHHGGGDTVSITFVDRDGDEETVAATVGCNLLEIAHDNDVELEGACEGSLACSTCHLVLEEELFDSLPEASEDEDDMLDLAYGLTETSRLGCQVIVTEDMEGARFVIPGATRNFAVDGFRPQPH